jgi:DNA-binding GntR family transcriptional regulator
MELVRVDTQRAYERIREKITSLELAPGSSINEGNLASELEMGLVPVREALNLLAYNHLVETSAHGLFVSKVEIPDLQQISEIRILLEPYCAQQAAIHATADDLVVLEALSQEQARSRVTNPNNFSIWIINSTRPSPGQPKINIWKRFWKTSTGTQSEPGF